MYLRQNWDLKLFLTQEEKKTGGAFCLSQSSMLPNGLESAICLEPFVFHVNDEDSPVACLKMCLTGLNLFIVLEAARVVWL